MQFPCRGSPVFRIIRAKTALRPHDKSPNRALDVNLKFGPPVRSVRGFGRQKSNRSVTIEVIPIAVPVSPPIPIVAPIPIVVAVIRSPAVIAVSVGRSIVRIPRVGIIAAIGTGILAVNCAIRAAIANGLRTTIDQNEQTHRAE